MTNIQVTIKRFINVYGYKVYPTLKEKENYYKLYKKLNRNYSAVTASAIQTSALPNPSVTTTVYSNTPNINTNTRNNIQINKTITPLPVTSPIHFDTHKVVTKLQSHGFTNDQAEAILAIMTTAMAESLITQTAVLATKAEHVELKAELSEKVFNSTLKFDIAQRHMREILERDNNNLKQEIRMLEKQDFDQVRMEIGAIERKFLLQKQAEDETLNQLNLAIEKVEKRVLQYAFGFAGTILAVGAGILRLVV